MQTKETHTAAHFLSVSTFTTDGGLTRSTAIDSSVSHKRPSTQQQQREEEKERNGRAPLNIMTCVGELPSVWHTSTITTTQTLPARIVIDENDHFWRPLLLYQEEQEQELSPLSPPSPSAISFFNEGRSQTRRSHRGDSETRHRRLPLLMDYMG
ncbi:uncharacterized protein TM35_002251010 [Trypanosoma theileri]|uniref:Uncharacterized protein n=1 Tax=Trypanosoma theileri TaxID=67003 RepID=A0A1X0NEV2_9TRYP|nr:uncharacterized protein TM35_002251010 [Trypanosoma theileri]ORC78865.1 hypothetical protein TM35_002251010 [Trypanosoma theileri]